MENTNIDKINSINTSSVSPEQQTEGSDTPAKSESKSPSVFIEANGKHREIKNNAIKIKKEIDDYRSNLVKLQESKNTIENLMRFMDLMSDEEKARLLKLKKEYDERETTIQNELNELAIMEDKCNYMFIQCTMSADEWEQMQKAIQKRFEQVIENNEELTTNTPSQTEWQKHTQEIYSECDLTVNEYAKKLEIYLNDKGNGKLDKVVKQNTGNCWLLGGINALISTEYGKEFLERNIIKDEEKHIFAVYLPEAKDRVYVFTEKEVLDAQNADSGLASGDGDIAAYALAVEQYLKEEADGKLKDGKKHFSDGNTTHRLFEIVTGLKGKLVLNRDKDQNLRPGITIKVIKSSDINYFGEIYDLTKNKKGAVTLADDEHVFSVTGVDGDCLLVQESNNLCTYKDKFELIENSYPPTYKIPKELFETTFTTYAALVWGNDP